MCLELGSSLHCGCLAPRCLYVCMIQNLQFFQKGIHLLFFSLRNMQRPFLSFKTLSAGRRRKKTSYENKNISWPSIGRVDPPRAQIVVTLGTGKNYDKPFSIQVSRILHSSPDLLEEYFYITKYNTFNPKDDSSLQNTGRLRTSTQV